MTLFIKIIVLAITITFFSSTQAIVIGKITFEVSNDKKYTISGQYVLTTLNDKKSNRFSVNTDENTYTISLPADQQKAQSIFFHGSIKFKDNLCGLFLLRRNADYPYGLLDIIKGPHRCPPMKINIKTPSHLKSLHTDHLKSLHTDFTSEKQWKLLPSKAHLNDTIHVIFNAK